jgi:Flp pilus assembly protein TadD
MGGTALKVIPIPPPNRDFARAEDSFWAAIALKPDEPRYLSNLGSVHVQLKQYDKALEVPTQQLRVPARRSI